MTVEFGKAGVSEKKDVALLHMTSNDSQVIINKPWFWIGQYFVQSLKLLEFLFYIKVREAS